MASKIKGITVEIGGDTTGLDKALEDTNKQLKSTQGDLKDINRLLKLDPSNVELLGQKQKKLNDAIKTTGDKLSVMEKAAEQAKEKLALGQITQDAYDDLSRRIINCKQQLERMGEEADQVAEDMRGVGQSFQDIGDKAGAFADKAAKFSGAAAGIIGAAVATIPATDDLRDSLGKLEINIQRSAVSMDEGADALRRFYEVSGDTDSSVEALSNLLAAGFDENQLTQAVEALSGAVVAFPDTLNIESLADSLQETVATGAATGQFAELMERAGLDVEDFNNFLSQSPDITQRQNAALSALAKTGLAEVYQGWQQNNQELISNRDAELQLKQQTAELAEAFLPLASNLTAVAAKFLEWFNGINSNGQTALIVLLGVVAAISPMSKLVSGIAGAVAKVIPLLTASNVQLIGMVAACVLLAGAIASVMSAWDNMSGFQKVISVLGLVAAAAAVAAVALGALQGVGGALVAAAAIAGGVGIAMSAVAAANKKVDASASSIPTGGGYLGGGPASYGPGGYAVQNQGPRNQTVIFETNGQQMGQVTYKQNQAETQRVGINFAGG